MKNEKLWEITHSLWILPSIVVFINGVGLMYAGLRVHKRQWFIEGVIYELPYLIFQFVYNDFYTNDTLNMTLRMLCFLAISLSLIRSIMIRKTFIERLRKEMQIDEANETDNSANLLDNNKMIESADNLDDKIDINRASLEELLTIPGFNTILAKQLLQYRSTGNYIQSTEDLANKLSLSKHQVDRISEFIIIKMPKVDIYSNSPPKLDL